MRPAACATEQHFVFYLVRTGVRVVAAAKAERIPHLQDVQRQKGVASAALGLCLSAPAILCGVSFLVSLGSGLWSVFFLCFGFVACFVRARVCVVCCVGVCRVCLCVRSSTSLLLSRFGLRRCLKVPVSYTPCACLHRCCLLSGCPLRT